MVTWIFPTRKAGWTVGRHDGFKKKKNVTVTQILPILSISSLNRDVVSPLTFPSTSSARPGKA